jgi:C4-dicarboxylate-specific signal transduction histidine kinase
LLWLGRATPNLHEARRNLEMIVTDGHRAGEVIRRGRALLKKSEPQSLPLDINDVNEVIALVRRELLSHGVTPRKELALALPAVFADRVQLQQVLINLVINGMEAMRGSSDRPRELLIRLHSEDVRQVLATVRDSGLGIAVEDVDHCSPPSSPPNLAAWGWDCRSAVPSSRSTEGDYGPHATSGLARRFSSP